MRKDGCMSICVVYVTDRDCACVHGKYVAWNRTLNPTIQFPIGVSQEGVCACVLHACVLHVYVLHAYVLCAYVLHVCVLTAVGCPTPESHAKLNKLILGFTASSTICIIYYTYTFHSNISTQTHIHRCFIYSKHFCPLAVSSHGHRGRDPSIKFPFRPRPKR